MNKTIIFLFMAIFMTGCSVKNQAVKVKNCENAFVVSDQFNIILFEHDTNSTEFSMLKKYPFYLNDNTFYDCKRNSLIVPNTVKSVIGTHNEGRMTMINLSDNSKKEYRFKDQTNGALARYKNGVLLHGALFHYREVDPKKGYLPPEQKSDDVFIAGKKIHTYVPMLFFDFDTFEITKIYSADTVSGKVYDNLLYATLHNGVAVKVDLEADYVEKFFASEDDKYPRDRLTNKYAMPTNALHVVLNKSFYVITTALTLDKRFDIYIDSPRLKNLKSSTLYKLNKDGLEEIITFAYEDLRSAVTPDEENIYIFTSREKREKSKKVLHYNITTKTLKEFDLNLPVPSGYEIKAVNYTKSNFIIAVYHPELRKSGVVLVSKDLKNISAMFEMPKLYTSITVTTSENIDTYILPIPEKE